MRVRVTRSGPTSVDRVGERHVVRGDHLRHRSRSTSDPKEPVRHLLARTDLGEGPKDAPFHVDLERALVGIELCATHRHQTAVSP
jgi:hypothetical protein